jgi:mRNA interferase HicA
MKRRDLLKRINQIARTNGLAVTITEGGSHTKVTVGDKTTTVPRHAEINELTARGILRYLEGGK